MKRRTKKRLITGISTAILIIFFATILIGLVI